MKSRSSLHIGNGFAKNSPGAGFPSVPAEGAKAGFPWFTPIQALWTGNPDLHPQPIDRLGALLPRTAASLRRPIKTALLLPCLWMLGGLAPAWGVPAPQPSAPPAKAVKEEPAAGTAQAAPQVEVRKTEYDFKNLGFAESIQLQGMNASSSLSIGMRRDEMVTRARLLLRYTSSPALLPDVSHIKVTLNGELAATIPLSKSEDGQEQHREIVLDPLYFSDFNQLSFQLIGHYSKECEDPRHSSIWATISNQSRLELSMRPLGVYNDLAQLPAPFFDPRDNRPMTVPFVFAARPSTAVLRTAGVVASWFGTMADYRTLRFPVTRNALPERHALVFATNNDQIPGLDLPQVEAPTLTMASHPNNPSIKLLLVLGRDETDLKTAADALVLSHALFSGESTTVRQVEYPPRRRPYDAPNWLPTDRPVKFGELVDDAAKLQVEGYAPAPIQINLRMPPDLWDGQSQGARLDLKYRYTPPAQLDGSTLDVSLNNRFVHAFRLKPDGAEIENGRFAIPLWEQSGGTRKQASLSPKFQMGGKNRLQFRFIFDDKQSGGDHCSGRPLSNVHGALDADSTIDLTNMPHYTAMPNLGLFVNNGFPFTKYADLAETTIALPERPTSVDMETFLALMGHMGKFTGIPALAFNLLTTDKIADAGDSDILVINASSSQDLLTRWEDHFPAVVGPNRRNIPVGAMSSMRALLDPDADRQAENGSAILDGEGPMAALVSFQSPLESGRTVVALMGTESDMAETIIQAMEDEGQASRINKNVVFIRQGLVEDFRVGDVYYLGNLPGKNWLRYHGAQHPLLLALAGIAGSLLLAFLAYWAQRRVSRSKSPE